MSADTRPTLLEAGLPGPARGVFSTRAGGVSAPPYDGLNLSDRGDDAPDAVRHNRELLAGELGLPLADLLFAEQVHGAGVGLVDRPPRGVVPGVVPGVDALVTTATGLGLVVLAADCLPVLLADPEAGVVAAAHAGRRGLVAGVLQEVVRVMVGRGAVAARTVAVLGPAAGPCCYEVPGALAREVSRVVPGSASTTRTGTSSVDLRAGAEGLLLAAGVGQVRQVRACTLDDERFYSYRRNPVTGRHAGVVVLR